VALTLLQLDNKRGLLCAASDTTNQDLTQSCWAAPGVRMSEVISKRDILKRLGFARELAQYIAFGILPVVVVSSLIFAFSAWSWSFLLVAMVFVPLWATVRFALFLGLRFWQWVLLLVLFSAGYIGSFLFLLFMAYRYTQHPPPPPPRRKAEDDPRFHPRGDSVVLDYSQPHGTGGAGG